MPPLFSSILECTSYSNCSKFALSSKQGLCKKPENPNTSMQLKPRFKNNYATKTCSNSLKQHSQKQLIQTDGLGLLLLTENCPCIF